MTAVPKPTPAARLKRAAKRQWGRERALCRLMVWTRDGGCCVRCGRPVVLRPSEATEFTVANIHERVPRSLGGNPLDPNNCETLCTACHTGRGFHAVQR